jgi:hypothetical protein
MRARRECDGRLRCKAFSVKKLGAFSLVAVSVIRLQFAILVSCLPLHFAIHLPPFSAWIAPLGQLGVLIKNRPPQKKPVLVFQGLEGAA